MIATTPHTSTPDPTGLPGTVERARVHVLEAVIEPVLVAMGYELVHVEWAQTGRTRKLQVFVDVGSADSAEQAPQTTALQAPEAAPEAADQTPDQPRGIGLDDCARLSPILSNALDAAEALDASEAVQGGALASLLSTAYVLEVSSPGLERPLSRRSHFERFIGRRIKLRVFSPLVPGDTQRNFNGRIEKVLPDPSQPQDDREGIVCLQDPDDGRQSQIPLHRVRRAHLVFEG